MAKKILLLAGDYAEDYETMVPFQILVMAGHKVDAMCPGKATGDHVLTAIHDFEGAQTYSEKPGHRFTLNATFDAINPSDYDALVIPGGRAPEYLRLDPRVIKAVQHFARPTSRSRRCAMARSCWRPPDVIRGRKVSAYPACAPEVRLAGAEYAEIGIDQAVTDGNLVTAPAWPAHPAWMRQFLAVLGTQITN